MLAKFADFPSCISLRLSVARNADLDHAHQELAKARRRFLEIAKLTRTTHGYVRSTEIARDGAQWNMHDHLIVFPTLEGDASRLLDAWDQACRDNALTASSHARTSATVPALEYVLKSRLGRGEGSLRRLISRAAHGDLDAADDWQEWDAWRRAHPRARFRASWLRPAPEPDAQPVVSATSTPRDQHIVSADDLDLARMALLTALGVSSATEQMRVLDVSESTIKRRRRHFPAGSLTVIRDSQRIPYRVS